MQTKSAFASTCHFRTFKRDILWSGWYAFLESTTQICQPVLLGFLLEWMTSVDKQPRHGLLWSLALSAVGFAQIIIHHRLYYLTMFCGAKTRIACSGIVNMKLLELHASALATVSSGKLINLVSNDVMRFDMFFPRLHFGWTSPLEIPVIAILLYIRVGAIATLSGLLFLLITVPLQLHFSRKLGQIRKITAGWTDKRMKTTSEIFSGILSIKAFVWETPFSTLISGYRDKERASIFRAMTMKSLNTAISFCAPNVSMLLVICTYWALGNSLSIALVFSTLALIHVLRLTIGKNLCFFFEQVGEARTSLKRIEHFLLMEERRMPINPEGESNFAVVLNRASFKWNSSDPKMALKSISISIHKEDLCVVSGPTGCGKSALLQAILGELFIDDPASMTRLPDMAYACQKAWIMSGTVKSNIVWGQTLSLIKVGTRK